MFPKLACIIHTTGTQDDTRVFQGVQWALPSHQKAITFKSWCLSLLAIHPAGCGSALQLPSSNSPFPYTSLSTLLSLLRRFYPNSFYRVAQCQVGFPGGSEGKESVCSAGDHVQSLCWEDPLEEGRATHPSILAWRIPWTEEPGGLQFMRLQRVGHDLTSHTHTHIARCLKCCSRYISKKKKKKDLSPKS